MNRILPILLLAAACGGAVEDSEADGLTVAASIGPQSLTHGSLTSSRPSLAYSFNGKAGDSVAPDLWPAGKSALTPTLALLGPKSSSGHRSRIPSTARPATASRPTSGLPERAR